MKRMKPRGRNFKDNGIQNKQSYIEMQDKVRAIDASSI